MLDIATAETLLLEFNTKKSVCIAFGPRVPSLLPKLLLGQEHIEWRDSIKYLGVTFLSGKRIQTDCSILKRKFYAACNCVLAIVTMLVKWFNYSSRNHTVCQY